MTSLCRVCGVGEELHRKAETTRNIQHQFSVDGQLRVVDPLSTEKKPPQRPQIMVVGAVDVALRQLLRDKGILTDEDLAALLNPGSGATGDHGDREAPGSS